LTLAKSRLRLGLISGRDSVLSYWAAVIVPLTEASVAVSVVAVTAPALVPPMVAPSMVPPSMSTPVAACVAIVPRPRLVLEAEAELTSDKLLAAASMPDDEIYAATQDEPSYTFIAFATVSK